MREIDTALRIIEATTGIESNRIKIREIWYSGAILSRAQFTILGCDHVFNMRLDETTFHYLHDVPANGVFK